MRRSVGLLLLGLELGVLSFWFLNVGVETGIDALQYHRMASSIVHDGAAPWVVGPLSYVGVYPGSDSSGVPFLAAIFTIASGVSLSTTVLVYDAFLLLLFGLGLFALTRELTGKWELALLAVLAGSLAYGFFSTLSWSMDERSFNVSLAPMFLFLMLPRAPGASLHQWKSRVVAIGLTSLVMVVSHLSFLLLIPFLVVVPLLYAVVRHQYGIRWKRRSSVFYMGMIGLSPLLLIAGLNQLGILDNFGLEYQLQSSALFSGSSPPIFLLNSLVFLGTRIGPTNLAIALVGGLYLASRPHLMPRTITVGGLLLAGFLGLPVVLYSKDLLTPLFVLLGVIGVGGVLPKRNRTRAIAIAITAALVVSGSVAFYTWNSARMSRAAQTAYWAMPGVTSEAQDGGLWLTGEPRSQGCVYGNNPVLLQQVTTDPTLHFCTGLSIDVLINAGTAPVSTPIEFHVIFRGISTGNPSDWFSSPELGRVADDFARLPTLDLQAGRSLLLKYGVSYIVVDLQAPERIPLYAYQGTTSSVFFADLWKNIYPVYRSGNFAIFQIN